MHDSILPDNALTHPGGEVPVLRAGLAAFLQSAPAVRSLHLASASLSDDALHAFLDGLPELRALECTELEIGKVTMAALGAPDGKALCPDLRRLSLTACPAVTAKMVRDLLAARDDLEYVGPIVSMDIRRPSRGRIWPALPDLD